MTKNEINNKLIELNPEKYSIQETNDSSYFFTLMFNRLTIYVEYFYDTDYVVSIIFIDKQNYKNIDGDFQYILNEIIAIKNLTK